MRQRSVEDDVHRVIEVGLLGVIFKRNLFVVRKRLGNFCHWLREIGLVNQAENLLYPKVAIFISVLLTEPAPPFRLGQSMSLSPFRKVSLRPSARFTVDPGFEQDGDEKTRKQGIAYDPKGGRQSNPELIVRGIKQREKHPDNRGQEYCN